MELIGSVDSQEKKLERVVGVNRSGLWMSQ